MKTILIFIGIIITGIILWACDSPDGKGQSTLEDTNTDSAVHIQDEQVPIRAVSLDEKIAVIKNQFSIIAEKEDSLESKKVELDDEMLDFTEYYDQGKLVKATLAEGYGHGYSSADYYLHNGDIFFIHSKEFSEASVNGPYTQREFRYYVENNKLLKALAKEQTSDNPEGINISEASNVDITDQAKASNELEGYLNTFAELTGRTLVHEHAQHHMILGKWQNIDDETNYVVFEGDIRKEIARGMREWQIEPFVIANQCVKSKQPIQSNPEGEYISCPESKLCWKIVKLEADFMELRQEGRATTSVYSKVE